MKRKRTTKKTEKNTTLLRKMADKLWSKAVRADWNGRCAVCGKQATDAHHLVPRQFYAVRHELINGVALCQYDHIWNKLVAPHQNPSAWEKWLQQNHPSRAEWVTQNDRPPFEGTKNAVYYCDVIRRLKEYVEPAEFTQIVGVRFAAWLVDTAEESA